MLFKQLPVEIYLLPFLLSTHLINASVKNRSCDGLAVLCVERSLSLIKKTLQDKPAAPHTHTHTRAHNTHTHTHTHSYVYIWVVFLCEIILHTRLQDKKGKPFQFYIGYASQRQPCNCNQLHSFSSRSY